MSNKQLSFDIPLWWFPSMLLVTKEHLILHKNIFPCPNCGSSNVEFIQQKILDCKNSNLPIGGDLFIYKCQECNTEFEIVFNFRNPLPNEDVFDDFVFVYEELLNSLTRGIVPDYYTFIKSMNPVLSDLRENSYEAYRRALDRVADDIKEFLNSSSDNDVKKLKLLLALISFLPEEDFNFIKKVVGKGHEMMLDDIRRNFQRGLKGV